MTTLMGTLNHLQLIARIIISLHSLILQRENKEVQSTSVIARLTLNNDHSVITSEISSMQRRNLTAGFF